MRERRKPLDRSFGSRQDVLRVARRSLKLVDAGGKRMEVFEAVRTVLAVRSYQDRPIPPDLVRRIVEAGRLTASSMNGQPWHFIVVENRDTLRRLGAFLLQPDPNILWLPGAIQKGNRLLAEIPHQAIVATGPPFSAFLIGAALSRRHRLPLRIPEERQPMQSPVERSPPTQWPTSDRNRWPTYLGISSHQQHGTMGQNQYP